jgi:hypothetical protein
MFKVCAIIFYIYCKNTFFCLELPKLIREYVFFNKGSNSNTLGIKLYNLSSND